MEKSNFPKNPTRPTMSRYLGLVQHSILYSFNQI